MTNELRYYATFKVRKFESLFYKLNTSLQKNYYLHWIAGRANIRCKYLIFVFFQFGRDFCGSFSKLSPETPATCDKEILK